MLPPNLPVTGGRSGWNPYLKRPRIFFYHEHEPYFGFTNFSHHPVGYKGIMYPTSEHLFQCLKVNVVCYHLLFSLTILQFLPDRPDLATHILHCSGPSVALSEAHRLQSAVRPDWNRVNLEMVHFFCKS